MPMTATKPAKRRAFLGAPKVRVDRGEFEEEAVPIINARGLVTGRFKRDRRVYLAEHQKRGDITPIERRAGERYAADYEHATTGVPSFLDPERLELHGGGGARSLPTLSGDAFAALMLRNANLALGDVLLIEIVVWVAVQGLPARDWAVRRSRPPRDGMAILRHALRALAAFYGRSKEGD